MQLHKNHHHHPHGPRTPSRRDFLSFLTSAAVLMPWALGQKLKTPSETAELYRKMSERYENEGLPPFKGITTNGDVLPGLFRDQTDGRLNRIGAQRRRAVHRHTHAAAACPERMYPVDDTEWRKWMNQHFYVRQGVCFAEMTRTQRDAAFGLMRASLSARGFELTRNIMRLNETLAELTDDHDFLGEWLYYITDLGQAFRHRAVGLAARRPPCHHQLLRARRPGSDDALFVGSEPVVPPRANTRGSRFFRRSRTMACHCCALSRGAAQESHPELLEDGQ